MHKNRTAKGIALEQKHRDRYRKMLVGRECENGKSILDAEYIGNSVYGIVKVTYHDNIEELISHSDGGFRPRKADFNLITE